MLEVRDLHKAYGTKVVLNGVELRIAEGEIVALLGANGAGKSTLLSIVSGLRRADRGDVRIAGRDGHDPLTRRLLGVAPQNLGVYPTAPVRKNLELFGRLASRRRHALRDDVEWISTAMGLTDLLDRRAGELSGGQQRRLHTAMALIGRPRLLLLDEPTVGADVGSRAQILDVVRSVARSGCAVCYTTHHLAEIDQLDANLAVLRDGRIATSGTRQEIAAQLPGSGGLPRGDSIEAIYHHFVGRPPKQSDSSDVPAPDLTDGSMTDGSSEVRHVA